MQLINRCHKLAVFLFKQVSILISSSPMLCTTPAPLCPDLCQVPLTKVALTIEPWLPHFANYIGILLATHWGGTNRLNSCRIHLKYSVVEGCLQKVLQLEGRDSWGLGDQFLKSSM